MTGHRECRRKLPPRLLGAVRVKTCGKSARCRQATVGTDKPCGLKCQINPVPPSWRGLRPAGRAARRDREGRQRKAPERSDGSDKWQGPCLGRVQNPAYRSAIFFELVKRNTQFPTQLTSQPPPSKTRYSPLPRPASLWRPSGNL
jgi:hypothetical protein